MELIFVGVCLYSEHWTRVLAIHRTATIFYFRAFYFPRKLHRDKFFYIYGIALVISISIIISLAGRMCGSPLPLLNHWLTGIR